MVNGEKRDCAVVAAPFGRIAISADGLGLVAIRLVAPSTPLQSPRNIYTKEASRQLQTYFADARYCFDLQFNMSGTPFQKKVWRTLLTIPAGQRRTYGQLAQKLHTSPRAIGGACRNNRLPIVVPCHRVVAVSNKGGYMGQTNGTAMKMKTWLLEHEFDH